MHRRWLLGKISLFLALLALSSCENKELAAEHAANDALLRKLKGELEQTRAVLQKVKIKNPEDELDQLKKDIRTKSAELEEAEDALKLAKRKNTELEVKSTQFKKRYKIQR